MGAGGVTRNIALLNLMVVTTLVSGCGRAVENQAGNTDHGMTSNVEQGIHSPDLGDERHGGPWVVRVPKGTLEIGVDTVSYSDAEEHTPHEFDEIAEEPGDGFPSFAVTLQTKSPTPVVVSWAVQGEGKHPAGPNDFGLFTSKGARAVGGRPSGMITVRAKQVETVEILAIEDHRREPCEGFRVVFRDERTGAVLRDERNRPVIAHGQISDVFDPNRSTTDNCP